MPNTNPNIDQPSRPRSEDRFDLDQMVEWLRDHGVALDAPVTLRQFRGGASNLTFALDGTSQSVVLRRPPPGTKARSAHDMGREVKVLRGLSCHVPVPKVLAACDDETVFGFPFYVMERLRGIILRQDLPAGLTLTPEAATRLCSAALNTLVDLHALDVSTTGLDSLGRGAGYCRRQVEGWSKRFEKARTPDAADFTAVMAWLAARIPEDVRTCIIHNDFRFDNLVLDPDRVDHIIGVLDWEMCTLGDPLMDLGGSLAYWVEADDDAVAMLMRRQPTHLPGMLTRQELVDAYFAKSGLEPRPFDFYQVFGVFRLACILQQIYYRWFHKQTQNPMFAPFGDMARYLESRCLQLIAASTVPPLH